jgi:hypothetical protein
LGASVSTGDAVSAGISVSTGDTVSAGDDVSTGDAVSTGDTVPAGDAVPAGVSVSTGVSVGVSVPTGDTVPAGVSVTCVAKTGNPLNVPRKKQDTSANKTHITVLFFMFIHTPLVNIDSILGFSDGVKWQLKTQPQYGRID